MTTFMIGTHGRDASEAFKLAVSITQKECDHGIYFGTIAEKYSWWLISGEPAANYDAAIKLAKAHLEKEEKCFYALCQRYKNIDGGIDYLFFGWMND